MKAVKLIRSSYFLPLFLSLALAGCSTSKKSVSEPNTSAAYPFKVGMAEIDITPPVGHRLAGYYDERFSTGVHDPLKAKAMVLQQGDTKLVMVFCDLVGLSLNVTTNARALISKQTGIPMQNIVMTATHSHTGPLFDDIRREYFHRTVVAQTGTDPHEKIYYPKFLADQIVKVAQHALANLRPGEVDEGITTQVGLPFNRRYYMKNGRVAFNPGQLNPNVVGPAGPVDSDVSILMVKDAKHQPVGGLTVFAMHADTTGGTEISADYPNYIQETLRKALGPNYISAFGAGTCGDLNQINPNIKEDHVKGFDVSEKLGTMIGQTVLNDIPNLKPVAHPSLAVKDRLLTLPLQEVTPQEVADANKLMPHLDDTNVDFYAKVRAVKAVDLDARGKTWPMEIQVFRLAPDTAIVFLPAEIFVEFGLAIKKASPFKQTFVIALANDRPSYMPTLKAFKEGSYEVTNSRLKAGGGEALTQTAIQLLNELKE